MAANKTARKNTDDRPADTRESLLDLTTTTEPEYVRIDGQDYPLIDFDDLGPVQQHRITADGRRMDKLMEQDALSEDDAAELDRIITDLFETVAPTVPAEVDAKLRPGHRVRIITAFFNAYGQHMGVAVGEQS